MKSIKNVYEEMVNSFIQKRYEILKETSENDNEPSEVEESDDVEEKQELIQEPEEYSQPNGSSNISKKERIKILSF